MSAASMSDTALESPSRDAARKALVGIERERQIAAQIRAKL